MKKFLFPLLIVVAIIGAFTSGLLIERNARIPDDSIDTHKLTGVWASYDDDSIESLLVFNKNRKLYYSNFKYSNNNGKNECVEIDYLEIYSFEDIADNKIQCFGDSDIFELEYKFNNDSLIIEERVYQKIDGQTDEKISVVGTWKFFDNISMPFNLVNLSLDMQHFSFFDDSTFSLITENGFVYNGEYEVIYDGRALELTRDGSNDIYRFYLVGNGLMLLSCTGNETGADLTTRDSYCLLEIIEENELNSSENISIESTNIENVYHEETDTLPYEHQPEGYEKMGEFNLIIEIDDFDTTPGEETILVDVGSNNGFYLEYPEASEIFISANYYAIDFRPDEHGCIIEEEKVGFDFVDNYTLLLNDNDNTRIVFDEIVFESNSGTIFRGHIDCYGYDKDESDIYYFATKYEDFNSLYSEDCGEPHYYASGTFSNYMSKRIYL